MAAFGEMRLEIRACVAYDSGLCNGSSKKNAQNSLENERLRREPGVPLLDELRPYDPILRGDSDESEDQSGGRGPRCVDRFW
jgi:hypothetical protein